MSTRILFEMTKDKPIVAIITAIKVSHFKSLVYLDVSCRQCLDEFTCMLNLKLVTSNIQH